VPRPTAFIVAVGCDVSPCGREGLRPAPHAVHSCPLRPLVDRGWPLSEAPGYSSAWHHSQSASGALHQREPPL